MINLVFFDVDDLLILTTPKYELAKAEAFYDMSLFLRNKFPALDNISNLLYQVDKELHYKNGYGNKDRFSNALVETYNRICGAVGKEPNETTQKMLFDRGQEPFDINEYENEDFMDGAKETLDFLVEKNCKLKIYTKGLDEYQREKIE